MNKRKSILINLSLFLCLIHFFSCRYTKPLTSKLDNTDTIKKDTISIIKTYNYLRISRYGICGLYKITEMYFDNKLVLREKHKCSTNQRVRDGKQVSKRKIYEYRNGKIAKIEKYIFETNGIGGKRKLAKTFIFDENEKLIQIINKNKNPPCSP